MAVVTVLAIQACDALARKSLSLPATVSVIPHDTVASVFARSAPFYATFQSDNQRVVYVPGSGGIFIAWLHSWTGDHKNFGGDVRVARSTNDGASWTVLLNLTVGGHSPPTLETDSAGNVYAFVTSYGSPDALVYEFPAGKYSHPRLALRLPGGTADKFASGYDPKANELYFVKANYTSGKAFTVFRIAAGSDRLISATDLLAPDYGPLVPAGGTFPHYGLIYYDPTTGLTLLAWTNSTFADDRAYYDIHFVVSPDHGQSWDGPEGRLDTSHPIVADDDGPSFDLMAPSEYRPGGARTYKWLESIYAQDGQLMFMYGDALTGGTWYRRFDWATKTDDVFSGSILCVKAGSVCVDNYSGFFSGSGASHSPIFFTSSTSGNRIVTLESGDDGATWSEFAETSTAPWAVAYAIAGSSRLGPGGGILGAFTDDLDHNVYFLHSALRATKTRLRTCARTRHGRHHRCRPA